MTPRLVRFARAFGQAVSDLKIRTKILLSFFLLSLVPLAVALLLIYEKAESVIQAKTGDYTTDVIGEISKNIENRFRELDRLHYSMITNAQLREALIQSNKGGETDHVSIATRRKVEEILLESILDRDDIHSVFLISLSGEVFHQASSDGSRPTYFLSHSDWRRMLVNKGNLIWLKPDARQRVIPLGSAFNDVDNQRKIGHLIINYKESALHEAYSATKLSASSEMFIVDDEGLVVSHADRSRFNGQERDRFIRQVLGGEHSGLFSSMIEGKKQYVTYQSIGSSGWKIVSVIPGAEYEKEISALRRSVQSILIAVLLSAILVSFVLSSSISKPIRQLTSLVRNAEREGFEKLSDYSARDEIGMLSRSFNQMVKRINYLITKVYQEQLLKQQSELKYLMFQINPHFLFNTLETINWLARINGAPEVGALTKSLGDLMREGIKGKDFITLQRELDHIDKYAMIQKYRYGDKFETRIEVENAALAAMVPKFMLQPLVENAIVHGLETMVGKGVIRIEGWIRNGELTVVVEDNGIGMSLDRLQKLRHRLEHPSEGQEAAIGILNVHQRLKLYYGEAYGIRIESREGEGTRVTARLSVRLG